ncbi:aldo/keto reductase [Apiospora kogelbergensis]|uniref:Aldo/keto reductase n=1 Tax=Apiospora kogelbergensis TaxID=1337665 RepID=A0AAW0QNM5_9PEZI
MAFGKALAVAAIVALTLVLLLRTDHDYASARKVSPNKEKHIPQLGLGTWLSDRDEVAHAVEYALDNGYDHIDAALVYKNENQTGKGIKASGVDRSKIWVTSKLWNSDHRRPEAEAAIQKSIADLGVDYLDLYLMHWPVAFVPEEGTRLDKDTSIVDTWRTMEDFVRQNYTRHIGVSNFARAQVQAILDVCDICPYAHEFETHPYLQQQDFVDWHRRADVDIKVIAYSPLANTNPTYRDKKGSLVDPIFKDPFWTKLAKAKNATVVQTVLAWGMQRGTVVIPKSTQEKHIAENRGALDIAFSKGEMREISKRDKKVRMNDPGKSWGVKLFVDLDDPTSFDGEDIEL